MKRIIIIHGKIEKGEQTVFLTPQIGPCAPRHKIHSPDRQRALVAQEIHPHFGFVFPVAFIVCPIFFIKLKSSLVKIQKSW
jgi:hypothetical protein